MAASRIVTSNLTEVRDTLDGIAVQIEKWAEVDSTLWQVFYDLEIASNAVNRAIRAMRINYR